MAWKTVDKQPKIMNETSVLDFGQYKGESIKAVMKYDPEYLVWLAENNIVLFEAWLLDDIHELADSCEWDRLDGSWYESSDDPGSPRY